MKKPFFIICSLFLWACDSNPNIVNENKGYDFSIHTQYVDDSLYLTVKYLNKSGEAFCVRRSDWYELGFLTKFQIIDESGEKISFREDFPVIASSIPIALKRDPTFYIIPSGMSISQDVNVSHLFRIEEKNIDEFSARIFMPFVSCNAFDKKYIELPTLWVFEPDIVLTREIVLEAEAHAKVHQAEWYEYGYFAYAEAKWPLN